MYRIDNAAAVPNLPIAAPPATPGFFTDGNPAAALEATIVDAWWLNLVQEEILTVIAQAGIAPDKSRHTQLWEALDALFQRGGVIGGYLPLTGGRLYQPGGNDPLLIATDTAHYARIQYSVAGSQLWSAGVFPSGEFGISDETGGAVRLTIDTTGNIAVGGSLAIAGLAPVAGSVQAPYLNATSNISSGLDAYIGRDLYVGNTASTVNLGAAHINAENLVVSGDLNARLVYAGYGYFHRAGLSDPLTIVADAGFYARAQFTVVDRRNWSAGTANDGTFMIADETGSTARLTIDGAGGIHLNGTVLLGGDATMPLGAVSLRQLEAMLAGLLPDRPDLSGFLPLTGGTLNSGGADPLTISANPGNTARIQYLIGDVGRWSAGLMHTGEFNIADEFRSAVRLQIATDGSLHVHGALRGYSDITTTGNMGMASVFANVGVTAPTLHMTNPAQNAQFDGGVQVNGNLSTSATLGVGGNATIWGSLDATHGTFYRPGGSDPLYVTAQAGLFARALFTVMGNRAWSVGTGPDGIFLIADETMNTVRLQIDGAGTVHVLGQLRGVGDIVTTGNMGMAGVFATVAVAAPVLNITDAAQTSILAGSLQVNGAGGVSGNLGVGANVNCSNNVTGANLIASAAIWQGAAPALGNTISAVNLAAVGQVTAARAVFSGEPSPLFLFVNGGVGRNCAAVFTLGGVAEWTAGVMTEGSFGIYLNIAGAFTHRLRLNTGGDLVLSGFGFQPGGGVWWDASDRRLKRDVADYERGLAAIRQLRPVSWQFNGLGETVEDDRTYYGLIADDVEPVMPEMVGTKQVKLNPDDEETSEVLILNCTALTYALVNAVKELAGRLEALEAPAAAANGNGRAAANNRGASSSRRGRENHGR